MEHAGVDKTTVGVVVPTGYSFNLDGTAIYLTMASLFIAEALGDPLSIGEQISLLVFMMIASKGAAGVTGAGMATLAGGLSSHRPELVDGVGLIVGIDRFMSEARALTNFAGNSVATVLIGHWTDSLDQAQLDRVLAGDDPFDETTMLDGDEREFEPEPTSPRGSRCRSDLAALARCALEEIEGIAGQFRAVRGDLRRTGVDRTLEQVERHRRQPGHDHQAQCVAAPDLLLGDLAALGPQPGDVRRHDGVVELGQVVGATLADLDVADQELAEVEADRRAAPEAEVDHAPARRPAPPASRLLGQASRG